MSRTTAPPRRIRHPWGLGIGLALILPQLVICVVVARGQFFIALFGFLMTIGFIRLGSLGYRVLRERTPPLSRGRIAAVGLLATVAGSLIWSQVNLALRPLADTGYTAAVAPPAVVWLNLAAVFTLGLWITGAVFVVWTLAGLAASRRP